MAKKLTYRKLVYAAYAFFILLSLAWFLVTLYESHTIHATSLFMLAVFCVQAYYNHRITNLVIGIVLLLASIFGTLEFITWGAKEGYDAFIKVMMGLGFLSVGGSLVLIFSYLKMSFEGEDLI